MKIQNTFITRGPNCWSMQHHRLIVLDLELQSWEQDVTSRIPNFSHTVISRLSALFGIHDAGVTGNELIRQSEGGTLPGYLIAIISLQLQRQVGVNCSYIMAGAFEAVFEYMDKKVGLLASQLAVKIGESLWRQGPLDIAEDVRLMQQALEQAGNSQLTLSITTEAIKRNIPCIYLYKKQLVQFGYGANQRRIQTSHTDRTSNIGMRISGDKQLTKEMLSSFGVPVPLGRLVKDIESLFKAIKKIGYPIVLKPVGANNGNGVSVNISNSDDAVRAFGAAARFSGPVGVIVEKFIAGSDYRLLVINHKLVAAAKRTPASVTVIASR